MAETTDHYRVLGLIPTATPEQIKKAYRQMARSAHPDAGGSAEAMEQVNEAYHVLGHADSRKEYDFLRAHPTAAAHYGAAPVDAPEHHGTLYDAGQFRRRRRSQARASAFEILKSSALTAILINIIVRVLAAQTADLSTRFWLMVVGFVPVYGIILAIIFLVSPQIRLDLHDFVTHLRGRGHDPQLSRAEAGTLIALGVAWIPLAALWAGFWALNSP